MKQNQEWKILVVQLLEEYRKLKSKTVMSWSLQNGIFRMISYVVELYSL